MTLKPYPSRSRLCAMAAAEGCVVTHDGSKTMIESTGLTLTFTGQSDITDATGKVYTAEEAFSALNLG